MYGIPDSSGNDKVKVILVSTVRYLLQQLQRIREWADTSGRVFAARLMTYFDLMYMYYKY
jgi:hypothetical protein